jgi:23S rRNA pseudouridine1911/1915/1917 synthase
LHATRLELEHPVSGERMEWHAPLPHDMQQLLRQIKAIVNEPA